VVLQKATTILKNFYGRELTQTSVRPSNLSSLNQQILSSLSQIEKTKIEHQLNINTAVEHPQ